MGINVQKRWSTRMVNSRESHIALNGAIVGADEKFKTITGYELAYPGDPSAPAAEVINCYCVLVPVVGKAGKRLKSDDKSGIIDKRKTTAASAEKAAVIEREFRYSDADGEHSPIDLASFAAMPEETQSQAAAGIRKMRELLRLDALPDKISFGSLRGAYGSYSEATRRIVLSATRCKDPADAYSTMLHEMAHYYDHKSGHIAESVYKQALKELGLRANSKKAGTLMRETIGMFNDKDIGDIHEIFAFDIEKAASGKGNALAKKILEIVLKGVK